MKLIPLITALALAFTLSTAHANDKGCPAIDGYSAFVCKLEPDTRLFPVLQHDTDLYGYADLKGNIVITPQFDLAIRFWGERAIVKKDNKWGAIDPQGKLIIPLEYDRIFSAVDDNSQFSATKNGKVGLIDSNGNIIIDFIYDEYDVNDGRRFVYKGKDVKGRIRFSLKFIDGISYAVKDGKVGFIDTTGKEIIPFIYDDSNDYFSNNIIGVRKNGKWGVIDMTGTEVIPFIYDKITLLDGIEVTLNDETFYIDETGNRIE